MLHIARFLKPFIGSVLLCIVLLFAQALCDLNLPNLMSDIVNVGIQQGGVSDRAPVALSSQGLSLLRVFSDDAGQQLLDTKYQQVKASDTAPDGQTYEQHYPQAASKGLYLQNPQLNDNQEQQLEASLSVATWTMMEVLRRYADEGGSFSPDAFSPNAQSLENVPDATNPSSVPASNSPATAQDSVAFTDIQNIDLEQLYRLVPQLNLLSAADFEGARAQALATDESLRAGSLTLLTRAFYQELGVDMQQYQLAYIGRIGFIMLLITLAGGLATVLVGLLSARTGAGLARNVRHAIFAKIVSFSHAEFDRFSTASLITRSTNDVTQVQMLVTLGIRFLCYAPVMGIGAVVMALQKSVSMSWIIGLAVLFLLCMVVVFMIIVLPKFKIIQQLIDRLNLVARETLNGQMVIRAFSREGFVRQRFERANRDVTRTNLFIARAMVFMMPVLMVFMNGLTVLIVWVGAGQVAAAQMQVGDMMAFMQYAMMVVASFMFIAIAFISVPRAAVSAKRITDVLKTEPAVKDPANPVDLPALNLAGQRGRVEFKDVSFRYEGASQDALSQVSFVAEPGSTTAFIGSTGSGKSTILNLIPRFYDATGGVVMVDGIDVRCLRQRDLRDRIGYVPQESQLLGGTVAENISYGRPDLPTKDVEKVAAVAQALSFIRQLGQDDESTQGPAGTHVSGGEEADVGGMRGEDAADAPNVSQLHTQTAGGLNFDLAQGGVNISGGQRQRLAIARALAINPDLYLFDDSFSALDFATDASLRKALANYTQGATVIIVTQRVSTILDASKIFVIDEGRVVGSGTHAELLQNCATYREIAMTQLSEIKMGGDVG
ncbi:MAG: ABC transporter ATP-binding protein/permease [Coriobacteriales bacterium]|jgi:ATP-binding cassette subfamily B protein|nr:ABC transporter ATP-binding protein/permease [Coriobacteriales bacterium]